MPVQDINAVAIGKDFTNIFKSSSTISGFWSQNADIATYTLLFFFLIVFALGILALFWIFTKKIVYFWKH